MTEAIYQDAGVNIAAGTQAKNTIKDLARRTHGKNVLHGIGLFSGFYELDKAEYQCPVIVSSTDGVGTKVKIARMMGVYDSIGQDLVNHCINDIAVCGANPAFFMDYIAADKLDLNVVEGLVKGIAIACKEGNCALVGGETAEMPGVYSPDNFDLAGTIVGLVEKDEIISGREIKSGDVLVGVESNGIHTNGYSLVRKIFFTDNNFAPDHYLAETQTTLGEELLRIHRSYLPVIRILKKNTNVHGISHITGGGIIGNTIRLISDSLTLEVDWKKWEPQPIFSVIADLGKVSEPEMRKVFNLGVGLVFVVAPEAQDELIETCSANGFKSWTIGSVMHKGGARG